MTFVVLHPIPLVRAPCFFFVSFNPSTPIFEPSLINPPFNNTKVVRTGEYHPSIHFLGFINTFLAVVPRDVIDDLNPKRKIGQAIVLGQGSQERGVCMAMWNRE